MSREYFREKKQKNSLLTNYKFFDITSNKKETYKIVREKFKLLETKKMNNMIDNNENTVVLPYEIYQSKVNSILI